jgi:curved DNA-binding protein CbpA
MAFLKLPLLSVTVVVVVLLVVAPLGAAFVPIVSTTTLPVRTATELESSGTSFGEPQKQQPGPTTSRNSSRTSTSKKRTLYEILGAAPTATRAELKKQYVVLARQSHPDALISSSTTTTTTTTTAALDFSEIAAAWRILSDSIQRRRYDRSLQAERVSEEIVAWAGDVAEQAKPATDLSMTLLEKFAIPLFRRTTATTLASFQAAAQELSSSSKNKNNNSSSSNKNKNDDNFTSTWQTAMAAAMRAGQAVDKMELDEKAEELQQRAVREYQAAMDTKTELQAVMMKRLKLSLHTPNSGMTSAESLIVLEEFNQTVADDLTVLQRAFLRHTIVEEIVELQKTEGVFVEVQKVDSQAQDEYRNGVRERLVAGTALERAERQETEARRAYEEAQKRVMERRARLDSITRDVAAIEARVNKSSYELERKSVLVQSQSEKVRNALRQKEREVLKARGLDVNSAVPDLVIKEEIEARLQLMNALRQEERLLSDRFSAMEVKAAKYFSRAKKLKKRTEGS